ncbi:PEP-CTERM sorting domain-containing protein [Ruficoccus amylovorans]|uniref:PEP-CTERM sorting domain-containing protein n=1 Tax=Ruficoccus amylovorans TaxID=1804625 RepID=A0A842HCX0_9BACT|nr:PEP-CTERM sorting domain-containing protein [Ruficoccus amylovorans]MBC2594355.1 PEP-CTERM sorting domain-containing protein [Ruficoccus amylovorans]
MGKFVAVLTIAACGLAANANAQNLLAYWNMDDPDVTTKLAINEGSQKGTEENPTTIVMAIDPLGFWNTVTSVPGTTENLIPPANVPNNAISTGSFVSSGVTNTLTITGINMSGLSDLTFSFASYSNAFISWGERMHIRYWVDDGNGWQDLTPLAYDGIEDSTANTWTTSSFTLPDTVDNKASVGVQIAFTSIFEFASHVDFDNIQLNAVPEPGTWALLAGLGAIGLLVIRRRLR